MKKLFTFVAVMLLAVAANATVFWEETFTNDGNTSIDKVQLDGGSTAWPYANQWFTGYTGTKGEVAGSRYSFDYTNVTSSGVSIRGKKLNGGDNNTIGLYFSAKKAEDKDYVQFDGEIVANPEEGMRLVFEICSTESNGGDLSTMIIKVNGNAVTVPATTLGAQYATSTISVELPNEAVSSLYFAFNNLPDNMQKFITHPRIVSSEWKIDLQSIPSNGGTVQYSAEKESIEAIPNYGYIFLKWSDGNTSNPRAIKVVSDTSFTAEFAAGGKCGETLVWTYNSAEHQISIVGTGDMYDYNIEKTAPWYSVRNNVEQLILSEDITHIGSSAFYYCSGLTSITIPNSVTTIGWGAFSSCTGLTSVTIGNSVTTIGWGAFSSCTGLTSITIPNSVTTIEDDAFNGCRNLTVIYNNSDLNIIQGSTSHGYVAYYARNVYNGIPNGDFVIKDDTIVTGYIGNATDITIPNGITKIGNSAFYNYSGLTSVTIPNSVTMIGSSAFYRCSGLTSITIPNSVTTIGSSAFSGCSGLTSITIPNSITTIEERTFSGCNGLTSITIPNSVTTIGGSAFSGCSGLTSVAIPNSITTIEEGTFSGCNGLTSITIPNSVTTIGGSAFYRCNGLTSITIGNSVTTIGGSAFSGCTGLTSITIPNSVTTIGYEAFYGLSNKNLKEITLPNSVEKIGEYAFANCSYLKTITLGGKLENIGEYAFKNDERLFYVNCYAEEPPLLQENAFDNYDIYLNVPCDVLDEYKVAKGWKLFNKENVSCISAEGTTVVGDDVTVNPDNTNATFIWPANDNAATYSLVITKDGIVFCTLNFNAQGQLTGIAFAPDRGGEQRTMPAAEMTTNGWQFTVTGLSQASKYCYTLDALDAAQQSIKHYQGEFYTNGVTALKQSTIDNAQGMRKMIINGQLFILRDGKTYNALGQEL